MWQEVACKVRKRGGVTRTSQKVDGIVTENYRVKAIHTRDLQSGQTELWEGDYFFSTMPIQELIGGMEPQPPAPVREVAAGLVYHDFLTVGLLVSRLKLRADAGSGCLICDNWIYVQEPDVLVGRLQIFNNWSPYMVADSGTVWLGLEYFCNEGDKLWSMADADLIKLGREELHRIGVIDTADVLDGTVLRMEKTYPAYFGAYDRFDEIRQ